MFATDAVPIVQTSEASDWSDVIEVVGSRPGQALKIDRRTYRVKPNPHSAQKDAIQLIRGLPAVTVTPDDQIMLLGSPSVRIFVDGRPYLGDTRQYLRTLHGSDIDRVEIITNPSAQYSAEGTGGIINLVLKRRPGEGLSGTLSAELSSSGRGETNGTLRFKQGKWSYELEAQTRAGQELQLSYRKLRTVRGSGGSSTINSETGGGPAHHLAGSASAKATYQPHDKMSISARLGGGASRQIRRNKAEFIGLTPDFQSFSQGQHIRDVGTFVVADLAFSRKGAREGETLSASAQLFGQPDQSQFNTAEFSDGGAISIRRRNKSMSGGAQIDWQHPMAKGQILSMGASWNVSDTRQHYRFESLDSDGSLGPDAVDRYSSRISTIAAYKTFQKAFGSWTAMPGIRFERNSRHISTRGMPELRVERSNIFPSFHLDHRLSKDLKLTISYSKRIDRAPADYLRPYPAVEGVLTIVQGNPRLKDQSTDAYEINLHYHRKKIDAGVIIYHREISDVWSASYSAVDGVNVYTFVNAGRGRDRGAQIDFSTPILDRVKLNASVNLFSHRIPINRATGLTRDESFRYTSNATLEWNGRDRGKTPGDVAQLQWIYSSPSRDFEFYRHSSNWTSLSYTHSFRRDLSLTGTANYVTLRRHRLLAPTVEEYFSQRTPLEFKLKLLKTFGAP